MWVCIYQVESKINAFFSPTEIITNTRTRIKMKLFSVDHIPTSQHSYCFSQ